MKTAIICLVILQGCAIGPFEVVHNEGSLPKGRINMTDSCKVRGRISRESNARVTCGWKIDPFFNIL
mgnify:CR=1 FL=1|jgi:hypothetical protein